jgi:surface polysaccharide O-acyltransferase-like enzyme
MTESGYIMILTDIKSYEFNIQTSNQILPLPHVYLKWFTHASLEIYGFSPLSARETSKDERDRKKNEA